MGIPLVPNHRLIAGWIGLLVGCIIIIYIMIRLYVDESKNSVPNAISKRTDSKVNSSSSGVMSVKSKSKSKSNSQNSSSDKLPPTNTINPKIEPINKQLKILIWCTLICYLVFCVYVLLSRFYVFVIEDDQVDMSCVLWVFPQISTYMGARIFLYLVWYHRLYSSFKESIFAMTSVFNYTISIGIIISFSFSIIFYTIIYILYADNHCQLGSPHLLIAAIPFTVFDLIWSALILYLFVGHLTKLIKMSAKMNDQMDKQLFKIYKIIQKLNILVNVSVLTTWIIFISVYNYAPLASSGIDCAINSFCILISLSRYDSIYSKICFICIRYYESCFMKICCCCCNWCHDVPKTQNDGQNHGQNVAQQIPDLSVQK